MPQTKLMDNQQMQKSLYQINPQNVYRINMQGGQYGQTMQLPNLPTNFQPKILSGQELQGLFNN